MNEHNTSNVQNERHQRLLAIQEEEEIERVRRQNAAKARKRAEYIRKKKKEQLIARVQVIGIGLLILIALIGVIVGIAGKAGSKKSAAAAEKERLLKQAEAETISSFRLYGGHLYDPESLYFPDSANTLLTGMKEHAVSGFRSQTQTDYDAYTAEWIFSYGSEADIAAFRSRIADMPISNRSYIFSQTDSADSLRVNTYLHDTNVSYISAVAAICLQDGSAAFLDTADEASVSAADHSAGMTVKDKLFAAVDYFFNGENTGLKYNTLSSLAVILSPDNNGTAGGKPSDINTTMRAGYADTYANIRFNRAMRDLAALCTLMGDDSGAVRYAAIAEDNAKAIRTKLYDPDTGRFIGWIDNTDTRHDNGDVFVNLLAVSEGIAADEQADSILSWIAGSRTVESDAVRGDEICANGVVPYTAPQEADRFGTASEIEAADRVSLPASALAIHLFTDNARSEKARTIAEALSRQYAANGADAFASTPADGLILEAVPYAYFDIASAEHRIIPRFSGVGVIVPQDNGSNTQYTATYGIANIPIGGTKLGVLYTDKTVYLTSVSRFDGSVRIGGLLSDTAYTVETVDASANELTVGESYELTASVGGALTIENIPFGEQVVLRITQTAEKK